MTLSRSPSGFGAELVGTQASWLTALYPFQPVTPCSEHREHSELLGVLEATSSPWHWTPDALFLLRRYNAKGGTSILAVMLVGL